MTARWIRVVTMVGFVLAAMGCELRAQTTATQRVHFRILPTRRALIAMSAQPGMRSTSAAMCLGTLTLSTNEPNQKLVVSLDRLTPARMSPSIVALAAQSGSSAGTLTRGTEATDVLTSIPVTELRLPIMVSMSEAAQIAVPKARLVTYTLIATP